MNFAFWECIQVKLYVIREIWKETNAVRKTCGIFINIYYEYVFLHISLAYMDMTFVKLKIILRLEINIYFIKNIRKLDNNMKCFLTICS